SAAAIGHRLQVEYHGGHREVGCLTVGHPGAAGVIPDRPEPLGETVVKIRKKFPLSLDMGQGRRGDIYHGASLARRRISDAYAIARPGVLDSRLHCDRCSVLPLNGEPVSQPGAPFVFKCLSGKRSPAGTRTAIVAARYRA